MPDEPRCVVCLRFKSDCTCVSDPVTGNEAEIEQAAELVQRVARGIRSFAEEMRAQGIHVGIGSPPRCVCGNSWPCKASKKEQTDE